MIAGGKEGKKKREGGRVRRKEGEKMIVIERRWK